MVGAAYLPGTSFSKRPAKLSGLVPGGTEPGRSASGRVRGQGLHRRGPQRFPCFPLLLPCTQLHWRLSVALSNNGTTLSYYETMYYRIYHQNELPAKSAITVRRLLLNGGDKTFLKTARPQ